MSSRYQNISDEGIEKLRAYMDSLPYKKGLILAYWVRDYVRFLEREQTFDASKLIRYKRGSIVKVHLGYRVGSEEGGLHYAVVLDKYSSLSAPTLTVIPLTSVKPTTDMNHLHFSRLYLGNEVYDLLNQKNIAMLNAARKDIAALKSKLSSQVAEGEVDEPELKEEIDCLSRRVKSCELTKDEILKMKQGSIALVGQITTVSKIRIYDPLYPNDIFSGIRLSGQTMDRIDEKMRELYLK